MKKRLFTIALALVLALSFTGTALAATAADQIVEEANLKLLAAESYGMDMELVLEMSAAGESITMLAEYEIDVLTDPDKVKMDITVTVDAAGEKETVKMPVYVIQEEDGICIAMKAEGKWEHIDLPITEDLEGDLLGLDESGSFTDVTGYYKSANVKLNGRPAGRYTAKIRWEEYAELFKGLNFKDLVAEAELTEEEAAALDAVMEEALGFSMGAMLSSLFEGMDPTEVHLYIDDETGLPVRYEADLAKAVEQMMDNMFDVLLDQSGLDTSEVEAELDSIRIDRYDLVMKIYDVNNVKDFKLPSGAKH